MTKHMTKKKKPVLKTLLIALAVLGILAIIALALAPQFLARQATQAPADTHTFVTRQIEETDLSQRMQAAVNNAGTDPNRQPDQNLQVNVESTEQSVTQPAEQDPQQAVAQANEQNPAQQQQQQNTGFSNENAGDNSAQLPPNNPTQSQTEQANPSENRNLNRQPTNPDTKAPGQIQSNTSNTTTQPPVQSRNDVPQQRQPQNNKSFEFKITENEISSMIYSGLVNGTAPAFRQSIQGVSTQISGGKAKISVALLPKYLPDAFLRNLPGITRTTPTVYIGGEMGLSVSGNSVEPRIYRVSLGNMGVPMPFIESAVRGQVQAYVRNATRLPGGQQAQLQDVRLEGGAIHIQGRVN